MGINLLTIHPGLPKTGTTYLQKEVFWGSPGYFGKGFGGNPMRGLESLREVRDVILERPSKYWDSTHSRSLRKRLRKIGKTLARRSKNVLISFEMFCYPPFFGVGKSRYEARWDAWEEPPRHLSRLAEVLAPDCGGFQTVLGAREQSHWLGSLYAQFSDREGSPGQSDFESQVRDCLRSNSRPERWYLELDRIALSFSEYSKTILMPIEQLGSPQYLKELSVISGLQFNPPPDLEGRAESSNARNLGTGQWQLRKSSQEISVVSATQPNSSAIHLTPELQEEVRGRCRDSNKRAQVFSPLHLVGYY